jgi:hypothetical protein
VLESALDGEGGGGEHDGGDGFEDQFGEQFGDIDGGGLDEGVAGLRADAGPSTKCASVSAAVETAFEPVDGVGGVRFDEEFELSAKAGYALALRRRF